MLSVLLKTKQLFPDFSYRRVPDDELPDGKEAGHKEGRFKLRTKHCALSKEASHASALP
jgi:hypothetical protein